MEDLDLLRLPKEEVHIGGRVLYIEEMTAGKAFEAVEKYQKAFDILARAIKKEGTGSILEKTRLMKRYQDEIISVCLFIITPPFSFKTVFTRNRITRRWLYKNVTVNQLKALIDKILKPILPDDSKKKLTEVEGILGL